MPLFSRATCIIAAGATFGLDILLPSVDQKTLHFENEDYVQVHKEDSQEVKRKLKGSSIIPEVIDEFDPLITLDIRWPYGRHASLGNTLLPKHVYDIPDVIFNASESLNPAGIPCGPFPTITITMTDPDAPSRHNPRRSEFCHWIATGFSHRAEGCFSHDSSANISSIVPYKPPGPPPKTGKHRYVFLAFLPKNGTTEALNLTTPAERKHWGFGKVRHGVRDWARENGLVPFAANFIYAKYKKQ